MSAIPVTIYLPSEVAEQAQAAGMLSEAYVTKLFEQALEQRTIDQDLVSEPRFKPEIAERLRKFRQGETEMFAADEVAKELDG